jgi:hypothetical protein
MVFSEKNDENLKVMNSNVRTVETFICSKVANAAKEIPGKEEKRQN